MPPKQASRERAWGTRYDTLGISPPNSPDPPIQCSSTIPQTLTSVATSPTPRYKSSDSSPDMKSITIRNDKMPHDASIFVGSLPSNIEHPELTRLLSEHLSEYSEVKNVKVVRDTKGGVCAFVQCEDAPSAARLIETLQTNPPQPFLGRILRFEPARAFRTLLISYRTPTQYIPSKTIPDGSTPRRDATDDQLVDLEPANAMRIYKPRSSKFLAVLYNDEALNFDAQPPMTYPDGDKGTKDCFSGSGVLFSPLKYDTETIHALAVCFGPIDHFGKFGVAQKADDLGGPRASAPKLYPPPHDAPRSPEMNEGVWEVKWQHRDDCVAALMTLRRVPHLTITWAHHLFNTSSSGQDSRLSSPNTCSSPRFSGCSSPSHTRTQSHLYFGSNSDYQKHHDLRHAVSYGYGPYSVPAHLRIGASPSAEEFALSPQTEDWTFTHSSPYVKGPSSPLGTRIPGFATSDRPEDNISSPKWSETDFPPLLKERVGEQTAPIEPSWHNRPPGEVDHSETESDVATSPSPSSSLSVQPSTPVPGNSLTLQVDNFESPGPHACAQQYDTGLGQDLTVPPTPEFSVSSITPITPNAMLYLPQTPQSALLGPDALHPGDFVKSPGYHVSPRRNGRFGERDDELEQGVMPKELDPLTIFVGGLEMFGESSWSEDKLRNVFEKYGDIDDVKIIRPSNKKSAFAFVTFQNAESGPRAISGEHNRIYDGRQIRVQLRENNPQRSPWRYSHGRGRAHSFAPPRLNLDIRHSAGTSYGQFECDNLVTVMQERHLTHEPLGVHGRSPTVQPMRAALDDNAPRNSPHAFPILSSTELQQQSPDLFNAPKVRSDALTASSVSTSTSFSPPPSTISQPPTLAGYVPQYPVPHMGYFAPQPWMHAFPPTYPYAFPFVPGYMGIPPSVSQASSGQDGFGVSNSMQTAWTSMNNAYKATAPYPTYQPTGASNDVVTPSMYPQSTQPPLRPTGFIQGEHGTLIPVYQPEALDQYMSNVKQSGSPPPQSSAPPQPTSVWSQYPQLPVYPYVYHAPPLGPSHQQQPVLGSGPTHSGVGWVPSPAPNFSTHQQLQGHPIPPHYMVSAASSSSLNSSASYRYPFPGVGHPQSQLTYGHGSTPPPSRRYHRRDQHQLNTYGNGRSRNIEMSPNRHIRGNPAIDQSSNLLEQQQPSGNHYMRSSGSLSHQL